MASKNFPYIGGTTNDTFSLNKLSKFILDASGLTSTRIWRLPNSDGSNGNVLTTDGSGNLSWASPGAASVSGVIIGDTDCGLITDIITANVNFGAAGEVPYSTINLGVL